MSETFIAIVGDPIDGFEYYGPFPTADAAVDFGNGVGQSRSLVCWACPLLDPVETDPQLMEDLGAPETGDDRH